MREQDEVTNRGVQLLIGLFPPLWCMGADKFGFFPFMFEFKRVEKEEKKRRKKKKAKLSKDTRTYTWHGARKASFPDQPPRNVGMRKNK